MGWDYAHATHYKNGKVDRKAECDSRYTWSKGDKTVKVLKSSMRGSVYYGALEITTSESKEVIGVVVLTAGQDRHDPYFNIGMKAMTEDMGPLYYDCPKGILDLLTPTENESANRWRTKCREKTTSENWIAKLPIGSKVRWQSGSNDLILIKHEPAYQFKTWFWMVEDGGYIPKKRVTVDNATLIN